MKCFRPRNRVMPIETAWLLAISLLCSCATLENTRIHPVQPGPLQLRYEDLHGGSDEPTRYEGALENRDLFSTDSLARASIKKITLERTSCYGTCQAYTLQIADSGEATFFGQEFAPRIGCFRGSIPKSTFLAIAVVFEEVGFFSLKGSYPLLVTDSPSTYLAASDGHREKVIWNYSNAGPAILWLLEQLLDWVGEGIVWEVQQGSTTPGECMDWKIDSRPGK